MSNNLNQLQSAPFRATATSGAAPILVSDNTLLTNASGGADIVAGLPALATVRGRVFRFENNPGGDDAVLDPSGAETINGAATFSVVSGSSALIYAPLTGTDWFILATIQP